MQAMHAGHPRIDTDQRYFTADEGSTWHDICLQAGMRTEEEQRSYFTWLKRFKIGNRSRFRIGGLFVPCPFRARADDIEPWTLAFGYQFPHPSGDAWSQCGPRQQLALKAAERATNYGQIARERCSRGS